MSHAYAYVHATEVGGTHPALVEAMGMGNGCLVADTRENREVAGDTGLFYSLKGPEDLAEKIQFALNNPETLRELSKKARMRVSKHYRWDRVTDAYESVLLSACRMELREEASANVSKIRKTA